jgi:hypothetical protein
VRIAIRIICDLGFRVGLAVRYWLIKAIHLWSGVGLRLGLINLRLLLSLGLLEDFLSGTLNFIPWVIRI